MDGTTTGNGIAVSLNDSQALVHHIEDTLSDPRSTSRRARWTASWTMHLTEAPVLIKTSLFQLAQLLN